MTTELPPDADPFDDLDLDEAVESFSRVLADGPLRDDAFLAALRADGAWGAVGDLPDAEFAAAIDDLDVSGLWRTQMAMWFDIDRMLDGRIFSHRLSAAELEAGVVAALPDFTLVDFDVPERRVLDADGHSNGVVRATYTNPTDDAYDDRFDGAVLEGPSGWLDGFVAGDVIGLRIAGVDAVQVERIEPGDVPAAASPEVAALAAAFRPCFDRWSNGGGDELAPATLDVLVDVPDAFRSPTVPLDDLALAAGLERRSFQYGPADRPWFTSAQGAIRSHAADIAGEAPDWLAEPFRRLAAVYVDWRGDTAAPLPAAAIESARSALAVEGVAGLLAEVVRGRLGPPASSLGAFVAAVDRSSADGVPDDAVAPGLHHLLGVDAGLSRRYADADAEFRRVLELDPEQLDAIVELGILASDRGDVVEADRRFRAAGGPAPWLEALAAILPARSTGRNDLCPCGSGRKFKQCCLNTPTAPVERRGAWYALRIARHLANHDLTAIEAFYSTVSAYLPDDVEDIDHVIIEDLVAVATEAAADYVRSHDADLTAVDRTALEAWGAAPVSVVDDPDRGLVATRVVTLGTHQHVVWALPIGPASRTELEGLLADDDAVSSVAEWALWYTATFEEH